MRSHLKIDLASHVIGPCHCQHICHWKSQILAIYSSVIMYYQSSSTYCQCLLKSTLPGVKIILLRLHNFMCYIIFSIEGDVMPKFL